MIKYDDPDAARYVADGTHVTYDPTKHSCFGVYKNEKLVGGVLFTDYNGHSCSMHMAGEPGWTSKEVLWAAFYYPFEVLNVRHVFAYVQESNERALQIDVKLGFNEVARVPGVFADGDLVILRMDKHTCRHLDIPFRGHHHGKQGTAAA